MAITYLESVIRDATALEEPLGQCIDLYRRKLYHQLTDLIEQLSSNPVEGLSWLDFHENFLSDFRQHLNRLRYAQIVAKISNFESDLGVASAFVESALASLDEGKETPNTADAKLMLRCQLAYFELLECRSRNADLKHIKQKLMIIGNEIELSPKQVSAATQSLYHRVSAFYYQGEEDYTNFYSHGIRFLSYTETEGMHDLDQWAHDIAIAAVVAPSFYDFGELSLNPAMTALGDSWVFRLLQIFIRAVPDEYNQFCAENEQVMNGEKGIAQNRSTIDEKIRLLALVKLAFYKPSVERVLSFKEISEVSQFGEVEMMLMRAMSLKLIEGKIDEIGQSVAISYVKPRILDMDEIQASRDKVGGWMEQIERIHTEISPVIGSLAE